MFRWRRQLFNRATFRALLGEEVAYVAEGIDMRHDLPFATAMRISGVARLQFSDTWAVTEKWLRGPR